VTQNGTYKPTITSLPESSNGVEQHCQRLQGQKRMIGLQARVRALRNGFLLVRVVDGVPVRWDDVTLTVRSEKQVSL
jgi:hypothetical protein